MSFGCFGTLGRVLSRLRKACSGGALFAGSVAIAEREEEAFKGVFCTFWERIGKKGCKGVERGATGGVKTRKGAPFRRRPYSASRLVVCAL